VVKHKIDIGLLLANLPQFRGLTRDELAALASGAAARAVVRGEVLFRPGDSCGGFHVVVYGQIKLSCLDDDGGEKVVEVVGPGTSFGESPMFLGQPYRLMAQALGDSLLIHVDKQAVIAAIQRNPKFALALFGDMSDRMHRLIADVEAYSMLTATERFVRFLLAQRCEIHGANDVPVVTLPISKCVLASRLNVTPEHLSRILHDLIETGLIEVAGRLVRILDASALRNYREPRGRLTPATAAA
jgi:CRP-like cAMP-binding protein